MILGQAVMNETLGNTTFGSGLEVLWCFSVFIDSSYVNQNFVKLLFGFKNTGEMQ